MILNENIRSWPCKVHLGVKNSLMWIPMRLLIKTFGPLHLKRILNILLITIRILLAPKNIALVNLLIIIFKACFLPVISLICRLGCINLISDFLWIPTMKIIIDGCTCLLFGNLTFISDYVVNGYSVAVLAILFTSCNC